MVYMPLIQSLSMMFSILCHGELVSYSSASAIFRLVNKGWEKEIKDILIALSRVGLKQQPCVEELL